MKTEFLELLRCPKSGQTLKLDSGFLKSEDAQHKYPIHKGIPRFVQKSNYADNFGMQWNTFRQTQLDSYSGHTISADRFWKATGWSPEELKNKWILDIGCGSGRFAEIALNAGAKVVALDYSTAIDACHENLKHFSELHLVQGDIYELPFAPGVFHFVYSLGVLQHTPNVEKAFSALPPMVMPGGKLCVDFYWKRFRSILHTRYLLRPITKRIPEQKLFKILEQLLPFLLKISKRLGQFPLIGKGLKRLIPVADYAGVYPLPPHQLREWALLDTFDMLAPAYDNPQTAKTVLRWLKGANLNDIEILHEGHLVGRGTKPI